MLKKDLGLFLLIVVVGAVVAFLNPRFISPINLENTANLVGLLVAGPAAWSMAFAPTKRTKDVLMWMLST